MKKTCETCEYSKPQYSANEYEGSVYECRRYPSTKGDWGDGEWFTFWPLVSGNEWCGEWSRKEEESDDE